MKKIIYPLYNPLTPSFCIISLKTVIGDTEVDSNFYPVKVWIKSWWVVYSLTNNNRMFEFSNTIVSFLLIMEFAKSSVEQYSMKYTRYCFFNLSSFKCLTEEEHFLHNILLASIKRKAGKKGKNHIVKVLRKLLLNKMKFTQNINRRKDYQNELPFQKLEF